MTEMRCGKQLDSDPVSRAPDVDCDVNRVGEDPRMADSVLRRASSLPEDPQSTSPTSPQCTSRQTKGVTGSRSGSGGIVLEKAKMFSEKGSGMGKMSATQSGCTSPSSSISSRCSRTDSVESPSHSSK